ncbi:hypothetical protein ACMFMG_001561 [Clarireedia jacksonii]
MSRLHLNNQKSEVGRIVSTPTGGSIHFKKQFLSNYCILVNLTPGHFSLPDSGIGISPSSDYLHNYGLSHFNDQIISPDGPMFGMLTGYSTHVDESSVHYQEWKFPIAHFQTPDLLSPRNSVIASSNFRSTTDLNFADVDTAACLDTGQLNYFFNIDGMSNASHEEHLLIVDTFKAEIRVSCPEVLDKPYRPLISGSDEASLLMHYLDHAFYSQFPFYSPSTDAGGRGWLVTLLSGDQKVYYATIAFSQYHRDLKSSARRLSVIGSYQAVEKIDYHWLALEQLQIYLREIHTRNESGRIIRNIQALTCNLQLVLEVHINKKINEPSMAHI